MNTTLDNGAIDVTTIPPAGTGRFPSACGSRPDAPWFCIWTKPSQERTALQELRQQGYPTYLPLWLRRVNLRETRIEPLFPRYLFAQPIDGLWASMRSTRGVSDVIRDPTGTPREVPTRAVQALLDQCAPNLVIYPPEPRVIRPGDTAVRALEGPLAGFSGICTKTTRDRVWLLLELLGRPTEVEFNRNAVEVV